VNAPGQQAAHEFAVRVYYEDTDAGGVVYYANYLKFCERARTEFLRALGIDHTRLAAEHGVMLAVRRAEIEFVAPARLDDALIVRTWLLAAAGASLELAQEVWRGAECLAEARLRIACLSAAGRPRRLPAPLAAPLLSLLPHEPRVSAHAR
jgi:acyl-CoA thioester hydrolase